MLIWGGSVVVARASSWAWHFCRACRNGGLAVREACDEVVPVCFIKSFIEPILEGAILIDGDFGNIGKEEAEVLHDEILIVEEGTPHTTNVVAACGHHLLCWAIVRPAHGLAKEVKLTSSNHVANSWDVIEHPPHVLAMKVLFFDAEHRNSEDPLDITMEEDFKFCRESLPHQPGLTAPQQQVHWDRAEE